MTVTGEHPIYSADSHVIEPGDLWQRYIDSKFRDRAPHVASQVRATNGEVVSGEFMVCEGIAPQRVGGFAVADAQDPKRRVEASARGYQQLRAGGWDPQARLKDQDIDGVTFEILYPSMAMPMFSIPDAELQQAVFRAYNDWLADFCAAAPQRLAGVAMIPLDDVGAGVAELHRAKRKGLIGAMIWNDPGKNRSYADAEFDRFWAAAADLDMPVSLHVLTGRDGTGLGGGGLFLVKYMALPHFVQQSLTAMLVSGVFARHPKLRVVSVENDIGWLGHYLARLRHGFEEFRYMLGYSHPQTPNEYFASHCWATFQDDPVGVRALDFIGADRLMWASDYPHADSTWPQSRAAIARNFVGVAPDAVKRITHDNVAELYRLQSR